MVPRLLSVTGNAPERCILQPVYQKFFYFESPCGHFYKNSFKNPAVFRFSKKNKTANPVSAVFCAHIHFCAGSRHKGRDQTVRLLRPFARRALMTLRPFLVLMRVRKPWTSLRWRFLGWKVLFMVVSSVKTYPRYGVWCGPRLGTGLQFNSISHSMAFCQAFFSLFRKLFADFSVKRFSTFSPFCRGKLHCHKILWPGFAPDTTAPQGLFLCIINYIIEIWTHSVFCGILT